MKEGFLDSYGYKVHYVQWEGKGPKILLIHSMGVDGHSMDKLAESLKNQYNILSLTILGHGDSASPSTQLPLNEHAEIMRNCYRQLSFYPSILIGHSVGGMMGMILTAEHPDEFKGLVLVDIAPFESTGRPSRPAPPEYFENEEKAREWLKERYPGFTPYYVDNRLKYAFRHKDGKLWLKPTGDSVRSGLAIDLWTYVKRITCPVLLLKGINSDLVTPETRARMEKTVPNIETVVVEGTGHMIPQDAPDRFEELVRAFLSKIKQ
ncbi:alpha/beta hydrolase [Candidatus Bathyarchaeota archaeon]|nr:alpha/beta hydrolase [Candidatus Bathyarchaeota archaeon]